MWVDDQGNEVDPNETTSAKATPRGKSPRRDPQAPSWQRTFKRGAIFAPIMLATVMLLSSNLTLSQQVTQALFIVSVFIPFSYFLDRVMYRSFQKRQARASSGSKPRG